ncbi:MAG: DUF4263 domain-containing protein [Anaerolineae bacterium]|nr:DUF4263 domain-containing protein [Anaerolineae bacterium]
MGKRLGDYAQSFDAILVKVREFDTASKPDIAGYKTVVLRKMIRDYRVATYWTFRNRHTQEVHHHSLTLRTIRHYKRGWEEDECLKITITDQDGQNEMQRLVDFLVSLPDLCEEGEYLVINSENLSDRMGQILQAVSCSDQSVMLIAQILSWVNTDANANMGLVKLASDDRDRAKSLVAALNFGRYSKALAQLRNMVERNLQERFYQKFLEDNYWMFGSEYSELISKRALSLGMQTDFPLRRTVDGYLDIIEIKTPLDGSPLFDIDKSHNNLFPGRELTRAVAQASNYLSILEADQYRIELQDKLKVDKVRAKVVIGRDGIDAQIKALRAYNADQARVEVITYDQLVRIAERILDIMAEENPLLEQVEIESIEEFDASEDVTDPGVVQ